MAGFLAALGDDGLGSLAEALKGKGLNVLPQAKLDERLTRQTAAATLELAKAAGFDSVEALTEAVQGWRSKDDAGLSEQEKLTKRLEELTAAEAESRRKLAESDSRVVATQLSERAILALLEQGVEPGGKALADAKTLFIAHLGGLEKLPDDLAETAKAWLEERPHLTRTQDPAADTRAGQGRFGGAAGTKGAAEAEVLEFQRRTGTGPFAH